MSVVQPLLDLQEIDGRIRDLQQELRDIPQRKVQEQARLNGAREALASAQAELKGAQSRVNDAESEVKIRRDKIQSIKQNQATLKTNKEFQMFNLEIAKVEGEIESFEARQVAAMDDLIPIKHKVAEAEAKLKEEQALVDVYVGELDQRLAAVQEELKTVEAGRREVANKVSPPFLLTYERLSKKLWPVVVTLQAETCVCSGCHLVLPPSVGQMVRRNQGMVKCEFCSRILYMA